MKILRRRHRSHSDTDTQIETIQRGIFDVMHEGYEPSYVIIPFPIKGNASGRLNNIKWIATISQTAEAIVVADKFIEGYRHVPVCICIVDLIAEDYDERQAKLDSEVETSKEKL